MLYLQNYFLQIHVPVGFLLVYLYTYLDSVRSCSILLLELASLYGLFSAFNCLYLWRHLPSWRLTFTILVGSDFLLCSTQSIFLFKMDLFFILAHSVLTFHNSRPLSIGQLLGCKSESGFSLLDSRTKFYKVLKKKKKL